MSSEPLDHVGLQTPELDREAKEKQTQSVRQCSTVGSSDRTEITENQTEPPCRSVSASRETKDMNHEDLGPKAKCDVNTCEISFSHGHHRSENEGTSATTERCRSPGHRKDDLRGVVQGEGGFRNEDDWPGLRDGLSRSRLGGVVREPVRDVSKGEPSQIREVCGDEAGSGREASSTKGERQLSCSSRFFAKEAGVREVVDQCASGRRDIGRGNADVLADGTSRRRSRIHAAGESATEPTFGQHGVGHGRDHRPPQESSGEDRTVIDPRQEKIEAILFAHNNIIDPHTDTSFEFFTEHEVKSYTQQCNKIIKKMWQELGMVVQQEQMFPKQGKSINVLEVMCSGESEITTQVNALGGRAKRFGLGEGDLSTSEGRRKMFQILVRERPEDLWYSPVCAPWCKWNQFNAAKSLALCEKVLNDRWESLWQLCLAVVLFRYQSALGRHFHIEQPLGSDMYRVPCMQGIVSSLSLCTFDLCRLGHLKEPQTGIPIRKRLVVGTSSQALHRFLNGKLCKQDHQHYPIAGSTKCNNQTIPLSKFTESYPKKFARQIVKVILGDKNKENPTYANEAEHPTKKRRLGEKTSAATIERMFPNISWQTTLSLADRTAPRVGAMVIEDGDLMNMVQKLCPKHIVKHLVLCRGTDRYTGPSKRVHQGEAPLRLRTCIRRRFEDIQVDEEWESWERLTFKGLRRKGTPARVSMTVFASVRHEEPSMETHSHDARPSSADVAIPQGHERPEMEESVAKRPCMRDRPEEESITTKKDEGIGEPRTVIDLASKKHGPLFMDLTREEQHWLLKLHRNLGHPGHMKLQEYCRQLGCENRLVKAIEHLRCSTCLEASQPTIARPSAIHAAGDFGDNVSMDGFTWTNQQGSQFHVYHFVDQSTGYQTAVCSPGRSTEAAIRAVIHGWISWAGAPGQLCMDAATEFNSETFLNFLQKHGIKPRVIATDAHWQNSRAERHGGILQEILKRMDIEEAITTYEQLEASLAFATHTKNQWSRYRGFPPEMLVFGKQRHNAASNISDLTTASHGLAAAETPDGLRFREELAIRERARRAFAQVDNCQVMRRAILQHTRPKREEYLKGSWVMIWRKRGESVGNWQGPMQVVMQESPQVIWVTMGSKLFRIAPEHVRPLSAVEESENEHIKRDNPPREISQGVTQFQDLTVNPEQESVVPPSGNQIWTEGNIENTTEQQENAEHHNEGSQPDQEPSVQSIPSDRPPDEQSSSLEAGDPLNVPIPDDTSEWFVQDEAEVFACTTDHVYQFEVEITQQHIDQWKAEASPHEMAFLVSAARKQRSEVKMSELDAIDRAMFEKAKSQEIDSWISTETIAKILRHQIPRENIMRCRWILTWKPIDPDVKQQSGSKTHPRHKPKARLVVLGFQDPQVDSIPRDSPTLSKLSRMLILQSAASRQWKIGSFDIKTAFLRGQSRDNRILGIEPPKELKEKLHLKDNEVLQLLKGAYGRVDAPYLWFMELKQTLEDTIRSVLLRVTQPECPGSSYHRRHDWNTCR